MAGEDGPDKLGPYTSVYTVYKTFRSYFNIELSVHASFNARHGGRILKVRPDLVLLSSDSGRWQQAEAILDTADREGADLIAFASHGRIGLSRVFYGSVAAGALHRADRPLLLIRSQGHTQGTDWHTTVGVTYLATQGGFK